MDILSKEIENCLQFCQYQKKLNRKTTKSYRIDLTQFYFYSQQTANPLSNLVL